LGKLAIGTMALLPQQDSFVESPAPGPQLIIAGDLRQLRCDAAEAALSRRARLPAQDPTFELVRRDVKLQRAAKIVDAQTGDLALEFRVPLCWVTQGIPVPCWVAGWQDCAGPLWAAAVKQALGPKVPYVDDAAVGNLVDRACREAAEQVNFAWQKESTGPLLSVPVGCLGLAVGVAATDAAGIRWKNSFTVHFRCAVAISVQWETLSTATLYVKWAGLSEKSFGARAEIHLQYDLVAFSDDALRFCGITASGGASTTGNSACEGGDTASQQ